MQIFDQQQVPTQDKHQDHMYHLRKKIILVTYPVTTSVPATTGLSVVLGVATIISVTL
jgi:hypothetical protein